MDSITRVLAVVVKGDLNVKLRPPTIISETKDGVVAGTTVTMFKINCGMSNSADLGSTNRLWHASMPSV